MSDNKPIPLKYRTQGSQNPTVVRTRGYTPSVQERTRRQNTDYGQSTDLSKQNGFYEAYVIKKGELINNPTSWSLENTGREDSKLVVVRAYIVETNICPSPDTEIKYEDGTNPQNPNHIQNLLNSLQYDFIAAEKDMPIPEVGNTILVSFGNNFFDSPTYHGIKDKTSIITEKNKKVTPKEETNLENATTAPNGGSPLPTNVGKFDNNPQQPDTSLQTQFIPAAKENYRTSTEARIINKIIIHGTQGSAKGSVMWFQQPRPQAPSSAHYLVKSDDGSIVQLVKEQDVAFHAGSDNANSIGIEMEIIDVFNPKYITENLYTSTAKLVKEICSRHNIPIDRQHIIGHYESKGNFNNHQDPGPYWDWDKFMNLIISNIA